MPTVIATPGVKKETEDRLVPLFNVVLLDDNEHTYEYVVEMLQKLFTQGADRSMAGLAWNDNRVRA